MGAPRNPWGLSVEVEGNSVRCEFSGLTLQEWIDHNPDILPLVEALARNRWSHDELSYLLELVRLGEKPHPDAIALFLKRAG